MSENAIALHRRSEEFVDLTYPNDPDFEEIVEQVHKMSPLHPISSKERSDAETGAPLDLRVNRPFAIDLLKFWKITNTEVPPSIQATLGPNVPVLIHHIVTPFAVDGRIPGGVWGLGYEFVNQGAEANTVAVLPNDEVIKVASVGQDLEFGLKLGGGVSVPESAIDVLKDSPAIALTGAEIRASTNQKFQFSLQMAISLRKVVGAPVEKGGALWKMYRQDEPLDRPHTLIQTLLVAPGTKEIRCTIKSWAKKAGFLGTRLGAKFWSYDDAEFSVSLAGLPST